METESHNFLSAGWRPSEAGGLIHSEFKGLRTRGASVQGREKMDVSAQAQGTLALLCLFVLFQLSAGWVLPICIIQLPDRTFHFSSTGPRTQVRSQGDDRDKSTYTEYPGLAS